MACKPKSVENRPNASKSGKYLRVFTDEEEAVSHNKETAEMEHAKDRNNLLADSTWTLLEHEEIGPSRVCALSRNRLLYSFPFFDVAQHKYLSGIDDVLVKRW
jgi:hypothetical protein